MINLLDKSGFTIAVSTLWGKAKAIVPTKTSQLTNDSGYIVSELKTQDDMLKFLNGEVK